ncbi:hypothetical protein FWC63_02850 [Candidatus Saccharibacteria bacterium]|nr:hypothetical protein [Candidatus Saccharibacteria bacterium]
MSKHKISKLTILTIAIIAILSAVRIYSATTIPEFNYDENRRAETVQEFLDHGSSHRDTFGIGVVPIFVRTDAGFSSLPFLAPATVWGFFFGTSVTSLRVLIAIIVTLALILLAHAISLWYKSSRKVFLLASVIALTLPWLFLQGILFWDTSLAPVAFIIAFYAFTKLKFSTKPKLCHQLLLSLSLIAAVYLYLPSAIPAFILFLVAFAYLWRKEILSLKQLAIIFIVSAVAILPFIIFFLTFPDGNTRTQELSIFYDVGIAEGVRRFFMNVARLTSPLFLFATGDGSRAHSIGMMGMLGPFAIIPIIGAIYYHHALTKNEKLLFAIAIFGIAFGIITSALTHPDAQPHSLRANAAAPFFIILMALGTQKLLAKHPKLTIPIYVALAVSAIAYYIAFFYVYLDTGRHWFTS